MDLVIARDRRNERDRKGPVCIVDHLGLAGFRAVRLRVDAYAALLAPIAVLVEKMEDDVDGRFDLLSAPLGLEVALVIDWRPGRHHNIDGRARDRFAVQLDRDPMRTLDCELAGAHNLVQPDRGRAGGDAVLLLVALLVILELLARLLDERELPYGRLEHRGHVRRRCEGDEVVELVANLDLQGELVAGGEQRDGHAI